MKCVDPKLIVIYREYRQRRLVSAQVLSNYEDRMISKKQLLRYLVENNQFRQMYCGDYLRFVARGTTFCEDSETLELLRSINTPRQVSISWLYYLSVAQSIHL